MDRVYNFFRQKLLRWLPLPYIQYLIVWRNSSRQSIVSVLFHCSCTTLLIEELSGLFLCSFLSGCWSNSVLPWYWDLRGAIFSGEYDNFIIKWTPFHSLHGVLQYKSFQHQSKKGIKTAMLLASENHQQHSDWTFSSLFFNWSPCLPLFVVLTVLDYVRILCLSSDTFPTFR